MARHSDPSGSESQSLPIRSSNGLSARGNGRRKSRGFSPGNFRKRCVPNHRLPNHTLLESNISQIVPSVVFTGPDLEPAAGWKVKPTHRQQPCESVRALRLSVATEALRSTPLVPMTLRRCPTSRTDLVHPRSWPNHLRRNTLGPRGPEIRDTPGGRGPRRACSLGSRRGDPSLRHSPLANRLSTPLQLNFHSLLGYHPPAPCGEHFACSVFFHSS